MNRSANRSAATLAMVAVALSWCLSGCGGVTYIFDLGDDASVGDQGPPDGGRPDRGPDADASTPDADAADLPSDPSLPDVPGKDLPDLPLDQPGKDVPLPDLPVPDLPPADMSADAGPQPCDAAPCQNDGQCFNQADGYLCVCQPGFEGTNCETNTDDCSPDPCLNGGTCTDQVNGFSCECRQGFFGQRCESSVDHCTPDPCQNGGECQNQQTGYLCVCRPGFSGTHCETNTNDCDPDPCLNGGTCTDQVNGFSCACPDGFDGTRCENNIDDCTPNPCQNGGTCNDGIQSYTCQCRPGFTGASCEVPPPLHQWTFNDGSARDLVGGANGTLRGGASIVGGQLVLDNSATNPNQAQVGQSMIAALPRSISVRTVVAWVSLTTLDQGGGTAVTMENAPSGGNYFDAIDYAEFSPRTWDNGSDFGSRSTFQAGPQETSTGRVMVAIVYGADNSVTLYHNGDRYISNTPGSPLQTYVGGNTNVLLGLRHSECGGSCWLSAAIDEARIYGVALTQAQIQGLTPVANDLCTPDPCLNGGTCNGGVNTFSCTCANGFSGATCATPPANALTGALFTNLPAGAFSCGGTTDFSSPAGTVTAVPNGDGSYQVTLSGNHLLASTPYDLTSACFRYLDQQLTTDASGAGSTTFRLVPDGNPLVLDAYRPGQDFSNGGPVGPGYFESTAVQLPLGGYWPLDETGTGATDLSPNHNHGSVDGGPTRLSGASCVSGGCLSFSGAFDSGQQVTIPYSASLRFGTGDFTVQAWVKATPGVAHEQIIVGANRGCIAESWLLHTFNGQVLFSTFGAGSTGGVAHPTPINDGEWHRVMGRRIGTRTEVWVDGVLGGIGTLSADYNSDGGGSVVLIGNLAAGGCQAGREFDGLIDDVRIFTPPFDPFADLP